MKSNRSWQIRLAQISLGAALVIALVVVSGTNAQNDPVPNTTDWSHRHMVFSAPKTLIERFKASSNPRYVQQWVRRNAEKKFDHEAWRWARAEPDPIKKDWSMNMGAGATMGQGRFPAKYSFDVSTAKCDADPNPDYVVYNTSLLGSNTTVTATNSGRFISPSVAGETITITNGASVLTMTAVVGPASGTNYSIAATAAAQAANFRAAVNPNLASVGLRSPTGGAPSTTVTFSAAVAGIAGNNIMVSSSIPARYVWTSPSFTGGANGQANIMAFDNLYSGCGGATVPLHYWAYNTGGKSTTSAVLSFDGSQVAFIQNDPLSGAGTLVIVKWKASPTDNFNNPTTPTAVTNAAYRTCTAPCMTSVMYSVSGSTRSDSNSSPFYDFAQDRIYVGDDGGRLRKFTGVFLGTPAETTAGGWPVPLGGGIPSSGITTSPVYDSATGQIFIGDSLGFLYSVNAVGVPTKVTSGRLGFSAGIVDSPVVDGTAGTVHVYVSNDLGTGTGNTNHSRVYQIPVNFTAGATGASVTIGESSSSLKVFDGDFDNLYYNSPSGNLGNIYVCGFQAAIPGNQVPTLWQIPMAGGTMGTPVAGPALTTSAVGGTSCSPVSEVFNPNAAPATDWVFLSVTNHDVVGGFINCITPGGCIMSFDVTSGLPISGTTPTAAALQVAGGASGVSIDNTVPAGTLAGASQVYFTPLANQVCLTSGGNGGCAIQASQSNLF